MSEGDSKEDEKKTQVALDEKDIALLKTYVSESHFGNFYKNFRRSIVRALVFFLENFLKTDLKKKTGNGTVLEKD